MVKTPKVSPLSNRGVRARRVPPVKSAQASHPGGVPEQRGMPGVGALFQSATTLYTHPGVFATLKPPGYRAVTPSASFCE